MKKIFNYILWIVIVAPLVYAAFIWKSIPPRIAVHFNLQGEPDRYGNKTELIVMLMLMTGISIGCWFLLANIHRIDPMRLGKNDNGSMKRLGFAICLFISAFLCYFLYNTRNNELKFFTAFIMIGTGILFAVCGNYFYTIKPNYFAGFRLPWTLNNPENWKQTHHLAGKLWFAGGLLIVIVGVLLKSTAAWIVYTVLLGIMVIVPVIFSWQLFRKQQLRA
jgi:uncharacterized membrane protein